MFEPKLVEIAEALVRHCRNGTEPELLSAYYTPETVSMEAASMEGGPREFIGVDAIRRKHAQWDEMFEVHAFGAEGPFLHGDDRFGVIFTATFTNRATGEKSDMRELAFYWVKDGKILREEFFYAADG